MNEHPSGLTMQQVDGLRARGWRLVQVPPEQKVVGSFPIGTTELPPPGVECVYALYNADHELVYVGRSHTVRVRLQKHWHTPEKKPHLSSFQVWTFDSEAEAVHFEAEAIERRRPALNKKPERRVRR